MQVASAPIGSAAADWRLGQTLKLRKELAVVNAYASRSLWRPVGAARRLAACAPPGERATLGPVRRLLRRAARGAGGRYADSRAGIAAEGSRASRYPLTINCNNLLHHASLRGQQRRGLGDRLPPRRAQAARDNAQAGDALGNRGQGAAGGPQPGRDRQQPHLRAPMDGREGRWALPKLAGQDGIRRRLRDSPARALTGPPLAYSSSTSSAPFFHRAHRHVHRAHLSRGRGAQLVFHLHRFHHDEPCPGGHRVAHLDVQLHDQARHRCDERRGAGWLRRRPPACRGSRVRGCRAPRPRSDSRRATPCSDRARTRSRSTTRWTASFTPTMRTGVPATVCIERANTRLRQLLLRRRGCRR